MVSDCIIARRGLRENMWIKANGLWFLVLNDNMKRNGEGKKTRI
jgi:hypothetical protein